MVFLRRLFLMALPHYPLPVGHLGESTMDTKDESLLWPNWVDSLKQEPQSDFIAQGTLINKQSIGQTLGRATLRGPVVAFGVRRIFNFALEDGNYEEHGGRYRRSSDPSHRATLNILETGNA